MSGNKKPWKQIKLKKGLCLDVFGGHQQEGTDIIGYKCHNGTNQKFRKLKGGELQSKSSKKCVNMKSMKLVNCKRKTMKRRTIKKR